MVIFWLIRKTGEIANSKFMLSIKTDIKRSLFTLRYPLTFVSRNQKAVMNLLEELGVDIYDQWDTGSKIMQASDGIIRTYSSMLPSLSYLALLDMWWFTYKVKH